MLTWPALAAPVVAPALGGAIATFASWRWIFLINIPIGVVGFLLALKLVHGDPAPSVRPLDWRGMLLIGLGIAAALIALEQIRVSGTDWMLVGARRRAPWCCSAGGVASAAHGAPLVRLRCCACRRCGSR